MTQKTFLFGLILLSSLLGASQSNATVVVYAVDEIISFEKENNIIVVRPCVTDALRQEILSAEGCPLKEGGSELRLSNVEFLVRMGRAMVQLNQDSNALTVLSEPQRKLLTNVLTSTAELEADQKALQEAEAAVAELQAFIEENKKDYYRPEELAQKVSAKDALKNKLAKYVELFQSQTQCAQLINELLSGMGLNTIVPIRRSSDKTELKFHLLKRILNQ